MHDLFTQVLSKKDLSKAGDLFTVSDYTIEPDLTEVLKKIIEISNIPDYVNNDNDQSVVEICITRVTSAIRETNSIEHHTEALVFLLETCLNHNLQPLNKDEDPPHAKIASDIISCIFLNYNKKSVMKLALPVAVKFLHKGNRELSRNMSSYLSLAAIENAPLLAKHTQIIIDSILSGNYSLCRVLPQIYSMKKDIVDDHAIELVSFLPLCPNTEKLALLQLFILVAANNPGLLEPSLPQICGYLTPSGTVMATMQLLVNIANEKPDLLIDHLNKIKQAACIHPSTICMATQVIARVGRINQKFAQEALNFLIDNFSKTDRTSQTVLLREATFLCSTYPTLFTNKILQEIRQCCEKGKSSIVKQSHGITIVKIDETPTVGDSIFLSSRTGKLHSAHRSMSRLNFGGSRIESLGGLHKSMTKLASISQVNPTNTSTLPYTSPGAITSVMTLPGGKPWTSFVPCESSPQNKTNIYNNISGPGQISCEDMTIKMSSTSSTPTTSVISRRTNKTNLGSPSGVNSIISQRISVFEPYPMRDTIQHFCEKHLDKIKTYMEKISVRIPPPAKCTIEEHRAKKMVKLHFACQNQGEHCLYNRTFFTVKTRYPCVWIHLMFLALQARSDCALSSRDTSVSSLKNCWDILKCENKTFLTLVTSSFPCSKDQDSLLNELRHSGFYEVFECRSVTIWSCFLCNHPERAIGFLQDTEPVIEGQLKEKKGRWKFFKRWRTRYFTLSGAHLSYKDDNSKDVLPISINQIRSVKVSRGARNIPKAFEIFTSSQSLILKPKSGKNVEEWVQCLSIVVANSQARKPSVDIGKLVPGLSTNSSYHSNHKKTISH